MRIKARWPDALKHIFQYSLSHNVVEIYRICKKLNEKQLFSIGTQSLNNVCGKQVPLFHRHNAIDLLLQFQLKNRKSINIKISRTLLQISI